MKKLLLIFILIFGTLTYSACEFPKEILKDSLASTTYNEIKAIGYENNIYCDKYGDTMLYYMEKRNDLQVGFYFNVESIENYIDRTTYYNKVNKIVRANLAKKIDKSTLKTNAKNRLISELYNILVLTNTMGWKLEYNGEELTKTSVKKVAL